MAPTLIWVAVTPGAPDEGTVPALDVGDAVLATLPVVPVVVPEEEQPATAKAIPSASAAGKTQLPRCSPMATLSFYRTCRIGMSPGVIPDSWPNAQPVDLVPITY
jgi:hypothetical protein